MHCVILMCLAINCSVKRIGAFISHDGILKVLAFMISVTIVNMYNKNTSGLIIYNVTEEDRGYYICTISQECLAGLMFGELPN